jgi:hypothetical protein
MYGTLARIRILPGKMDELRALMAEWERDLRPKFLPRQRR